MNIVRKYNLFKDKFFVKIPDSYIWINDTGMNNAECFRDKDGNTIIIMESEASDVNSLEQNMLMYNDIKGRCNAVSEPECSYRIVDGVRQSRLYFNVDLNKHYILVSYQMKGYFYVLIMYGVGVQYEKWKKDIDYILDSINSIGEESNGD